MSETILRGNVSPVIPDTTTAAAPAEGHAAFPKQSHRLRHDPINYCDALEDAERLLKFAAESGFAVDDATRDSVLEARMTDREQWTEKTVASLWSHSPNWLRSLSLSPPKACAS